MKFQTITTADHDTSKPLFDLETGVAEDSGDQFVEASCCDYYLWYVYSEAPVE